MELKVEPPPPSLPPFFFTLKALVNFIWGPKKKQKTKYAHLASDPQNVTPGMEGEATCYSMVLSLCDFDQIFTDT